MRGAVEHVHAVRYGTNDRNLERTVWQPGAGATWQCHVAARCGWFGRGVERSPLRPAVLCAARPRRSKKTQIEMIKEKLRLMQARPAAQTFAPAFRANLSRERGKQTRTVSYFFPGSYMVSRMEPKVCAVFERDFESTSAPRLAL